MMLTWVLGFVVSVIALAIPIYIYFDKKKSKKLDDSFLDLWTNLEGVKSEKDRIDRQVVSLSKEVEMIKVYNERQFASIDDSQRELRAFSLRQGEEIKKLIEDLAHKLDKYFDGINELNVKLVAHISKEEK